MKRAIPFVFAVLFASSAYAADGAAQTLSEEAEMPILDAVDVTLSDFLWEKRPIVVFADTPADPAFQRQVDLLTDRLEALEDRDVVVIVDTDPEAETALREKLRPRGFMLVLIGKDGGVKLRKPAPWNVRELSRTIDKMPMRQQELRDRRAGEG